jgi:hypothetical protein
MKKLLAFCFLSLMFCATVNAQTYPLKSFWKMVNVKYAYNEMPLGMKSWLYEMAEKKAKSHTKALALLENIRNEVTFQDELLLVLYVNNHTNEENLKRVLGTLCGSHAIGNPVADYIFTKYKNDPRALKLIKEEKIAFDLKRKAEEDKKKRVSDSVRESYKTKVFSRFEIDEKITAINTSVVDSLLDKKVLDLLIEKKLRMNWAYDFGRVLTIDAVWLVVDSLGNVTALNEKKNTISGIDRNEETIVKIEVFNLFKYLNFDIPRYNGYPVKCDMLLPFARQYVVNDDQFRVDENGVIFWEFVEGSGKVYKRLKLEKDAEDFVIFYDLLKDRGVYSVKTLTRWDNPKPDDSDLDNETLKWKLAKVIKVFEVKLLNK